MGAKPEDREAAQQRLRDAQDDIVKKHPGHRERFDSENGALEKKQQQLGAANANAGAAVQRAGAANERESNMYAGLNTPPAGPAKSEAKADPPRPDAKTPEARKTVASAAGKANPTV